MKDDDIDDPIDAQNFLDNLRKFIEVTLNNEDDDAPELPFTHFLAALNMEIFEPGFVMIASPILAKTEDGISYPTDVGLMINSSIDLTHIDLGKFLSGLGNAITNNVDSALDIENLLKGTSND